ncbi:hypothetical protein ACFLU4_00975 [Chloroflexota bacterium]
MYQHKQTGWTLIIPVGVAVLVIGYFSIQDPSWIALLVFVILLVTLWLFSGLTVMVDEHAIQVRFGPGVIKKTIKLADIQSAKPVRNKWWYGWGIRAIPGGWLYNISGLDAVELLMMDGRIYRVGTDEQQQLSDFIQERLGR